MIKKLTFGYNNKNKTKNNSLILSRAATLHSLNINMMKNPATSLVPASILFSIICLLPEMKKKKIKLSSLRI